MEEQINRWQIEQKKKYKSPIRPVITMSRLAGAGGSIIAQKLAESLSIDFFDSSIVTKIAENAKVSEQVIKTLDEQDRSIFDEWLQALDDHHLWSYEYLDHLVKVVSAIGAHGYAIIVGRGASFILPQEVCLRVLVIAPLEKRVDSFAQQYEVSESEAKKQIVMADSARRGFIRKYFSTDMTDPMHYDLVINTKNLDFDVAVNIITEAFNSRQWYNYNLKR